MTRQRLMNRILLVMACCFIILNILGTTYGIDKSVQDITLRKLIKQQFDMAMNTQKTLSYSFKAQHRIDETMTGSGEVTIGIEDGKTQMIFRDHKHDMNHYFDSRKKLHIIEYQADEMIKLLDSVQSSGRLMNELKTGTTQKNQMANILCQPMEESFQLEQWMDQKLKLLSGVSYFDEKVNQCTKKYGAELMGRYIIFCIGKEDVVEKLITSHLEITLSTPNKIPDVEIPKNLEKICEKGTLQQAIYNILSKQKTKKNDENQTNQIKEQKKEGKWFERVETCDKPTLSSKENCDKLMREDKPKRTCIFLHGVGEWETKPTLKTFPDYWGNIEKYTPHCKEHKFVCQETKIRGWDDPTLQQAYCDIMLEGNEPGDNVIRNKIVYSHSMGNLVLAAALRNGFCILDKTTTTYYEVQGPMLGSLGASFIEKVCQNESNPLYRTIANLGGYCIKEEQRVYPAYITLKPDYNGIEGLADITQNYRKGALCGTSSLGLYTPYSVLYLISKAVSFGEDNDGMVPITSCGVEEIDKFVPDFDEPFYATASNHADGTCRSGDGWWDRKRAPCSWYSQRK